MLCLATKESYFIFNGLLNKQTDGVEMGSPFGPSLANTFLSYNEKNWSKSCPQGFKPVFYRRYVDIIFVLFKSNDRLKYFQELLISCHINMSFSMETGIQNKFSFLDIKIIHEQGKFSTTVYRKPTFSGVCRLKIWYGLHLGLRMFSYLLALKKVTFRISFSEKDIS